ncbi:hypothetical protein D9M72_589320 [compost metagenome]
MLQQIQHRPPEVVDVTEDHRLAVTAKLRPGHDLDDLFQSADAARERHESVGPFEHRVFALVHVGSDDQFVQLAERMAGGFLVHEEFRDDPGDFAAVGKDAAGDGSHDAARAAAIDQAKTVIGNRAAKCAAGFHVGVVASRL